MADTVEQVSLNGGVVQHVLENDVIANLERVGKTPGTHEVARQTTVAPDAVHTGVGGMVVQL